jgi:hypothetical protein
MMTGAKMSDPYSRWQRLIARFLPWFDPEVQTEKIRHTVELAEEVGRIDSIRIAYKQMGDRPYISRRRLR